MNNSLIRSVAGFFAVTLVVAGCGQATSLVSSAPPQIPVTAADGGIGVAASSSYPVPGRIEYRLQAPPPALPDIAAGYRLAATASAASVARLANAFGLHAAVVADESGWSASTAGHMLRVQRAGGLPWSWSAVSGGGAVGSGCAIAGPATATAATGSTSQGSPASTAPAKPGAPLAPWPPLTCPPPTTVPGLGSRADAERLARDTFSAAGLDLASASVTVSGGQSDWFVSIAPSVAKVPVARTAWSLTVGPYKTLEFASGYLAQPVAAGNYQLVGVTEGVRRLQQGSPWVSYGRPGPMPLMGVPAAGAPVAAAAPPAIAPSTCPTIVACAAPVRPSPACRPPLSCPTLPPPPPTVVVITGVHLGLGWVSPLGGPTTSEAWLVPVYVFDVSPGGTIPVIAVADRYLAPASSPSTPPPPKPGGAQQVPAPAVTSSGSTSVTPKLAAPKPEAAKKSWGVVDGQE